MPDIIKSKILVIDDDEDSRKVLMRIFRDEKEYDVCLASNGKEAIEIIADYKPDLILLDIVMPGMNGYDFAGVLKSKPDIRDIPIIFLTGRRDIESRVFAFERGGVDYICKPFSHVELLARVKVHIKLRKMNIELKEKNALLAKREKHLQHLVDKRTIQLQKQLYTDSLTGLPNRFRLMKDIYEIESPSLVLINIDSFKEINAFYGHIIGDSVIVELSHRLSAITKRHQCQLYKLHADEFAVLIQYKIDKKSLTQLVQNLHDEGELKPYVIKSDNSQEHMIILDIYLGVSFDNNKDNILEYADMALKFTKRNNKHWMIYDKSMKMKKEYGNNLKWTRIINSAIKNNRIITHFQPIFNNKNKNLEKYETLVRLINKSGKIILPDTFLNIAKKTKQYVHITKRVVQEALKYFKDKKSDLSINLFVEDMLNAETVEFIIDNLIKYNIGNQVVFEILESEGIECYEQVYNFIKQVKKIGCKIAIDDFGSGYSNFDHILKLNVDYLKIDSSLIENIDKDKNSQIIVETIVDFCKKLDISTIAEKVHSKTVFDTVVSLGVCYSQGFYLGGPLALY